MTKLAPHIQRIKQGYGDKFTGRKTMIPFDADKVTLRDNWREILVCRKKPIIIQAIKINFPEGFTVTSRKGLLKGKPGDYLMFGVDGEKYICEKEIFERTYEVLGKLGMPK